MTRDPRQAGSAALELVLLTPVLVTLMLFIVFAGRAGEGLSELRHAADQGARAASQSARGRMPQAARTAVMADLQSSGVSCTNPIVALSVQTGVPASVTVTVTCRVSTRGLGLLRTGDRTIRASSTEILDRYRTDR
jgi:Flp pilus assembly protein TadG